MLQNRLSRRQRRKRPQQKRLQQLKKRLLSKRQRLQRKQQLQKRPRRRLRLHLLRQRSRLQSPQRNLQRSPRLFRRDGKSIRRNYGVKSNMAIEFTLLRITMVTVVLKVGTKANGLNCILQRKRFTIMKMKNISM